MNTQPQLAQASAAPAESFFRDIGGIVIELPALQRPTLEELRAKTPWIYAIEQDISPVEMSFLRLGTVLREDEQYPIKGDEYKRRITSTSKTFFGYQHALWLVERQDEFPECVEIFKKVYEDEPVVYSRPYMDFLGFIRRTDRKSVV